MAQSCYYSKLKYRELLKAKMMKCYRRPQDISLVVTLVLQQGNLQLKVICCSEDMSKPGIKSCEARKAPEEYKCFTKIQDTCVHSKKLISQRSNESGILLNQAHEK